MTIQEKIEFKKKVADKIAHHLYDEFRNICPKYCSIYDADPNHLVSFAVLVIEEALINKKIILQNID